MLSLCLLSVSWGWQGRAEYEKGLSSLAPDQQRSCSCFPVCSLVSQKHISHLFVRAMAAAGLPKSGKSKAHRSPNSVGLPTLDKLQKMTRGAPQQCSTPSQQPPVMLPQPQNVLTGLGTRLATSLLDQPQGTHVQYQPSGNDLTPLATGAWRERSDAQLSLCRHR